MSQRAFLRRVLAEGAERLAVRVDAGGEVFGWRDRTLGAPVDRDGQRLWLRVTGEHRDWASTPGWTGNRDAARLTAIPKPDLIDRVEWVDEDVIECAELMTYVQDPVCSRTPELRNPIDLPDRWWSAMRTAVDALARTPTDRGSEDPDRYVAALRVFFGAKADHLEPGWATEHTDLQWSNLTAPRLWLLDWESWGRAPAGYGAASLYCHSLLVPEIARRVHQVFANLLDTPEGHYAQLCVISDMLRRADGGDYPDLVCPLHEVADRILVMRVDR